MVAGFLSAKKLRRLFAETPVIVPGVLIAPGFDDYRVNQYERRLAIDYVQRIQNDLIRDLDHIERVRVRRVKIKRESLEAVGPVIRRQAQVPADLEAFLKQLARGGIWGTTAAVCQRRVLLPHTCR